MTMYILYYNACHLAKELYLALKFLKVAYLMCLCILFRVFDKVV